MGDLPIVIVGGGPAGLSAARAYRERGGAAPVLLIGDDPDPPYERPLLSKELLRGERGRDELPLEDRSFYAEQSIELRTGERVIGLDADSRAVELSSGESIGYGACVLATGSRPVLPDISGVQLDGVQNLRRVADCERLRGVAGEGARVLVVGSGFIGCEAAISMATRGTDVTVATAEAMPQAERLGAAVGERIARWLEQAGIELRPEAELTAIERHGSSLAASFAGAEEAEADLVLLALGIERNRELAEAAGIELSGEGIAVDERMRTSAAGVLAAGDVAVAHNPTAGRRLEVEHWGEALRQGEIAGAVLAGDEDQRWASVPGFWSDLGERTLKYVAWGDGFDEAELTEHDGGGFTARYERDGELVGVLTHEADEDYERGRELVEARTSWR